jgi:hypothetical protein
MTTESPGAARAGTSPRPRLAVIGAVIAALALAGALIWLFSGEGDQPKPPVNLSDLAFVDGTLNVVEDDLLVMTAFQPVDGRGEITFSIPEKYQPNFDMAHLRSHSSVGIPTRVYYIEQNGQFLAVYKADAPANGPANRPSAGS